MGDAINSLTRIIPHANKVDNTLIMPTKVMVDLQEWVNDHWDVYSIYGSGEISKLEFRKLVKDVFEGYDLNPVETWQPIDKVFRDFDKDRSGLINREEATQLLRFCWAWAKVYEEWRKLGKSEDDALSCRQFRLFARKFLDLMGYDPEWRRDEFDALMKTYDADNDGEIDQDEAFAFLHDFAGSQGEWFPQQKEEPQEAEIHL